MNFPANDPLQDELRDLDRRIAELGLTIWIGAEPTFTDRFSEAPQWLNTALGGDKEQRAEQLLRRYLDRFPGAALLRSVGRQYPGEERARWNMGLFGRRDGQPAWRGPPDPLCSPGAEVGDPAARLAQWRAALIRLCEVRGWPLRWQPMADPLRVRLLLRMDAGEPPPSTVEESLLLRPSVHAGPLPGDGLRDPLAEQGLCLLELGQEGPEAYAELPLLGETAPFLSLLDLLAEAANEAALPNLRLRGYPPPVNHEVFWSTLTPDPAVIEANLAPAAGLAEFHDMVAPLYQAAHGGALSPYRLQYNGREQDSGGGGQITVGGPRAGDSPFFVEPQLLPRLIRYFNEHPGLSYWFATDYVGSGSQGPRPDESPRERFLELALALEQVEASASPNPEFIWRSFAPFLADASGNSHRSELNIEKLWNPYLGSPGRQGLVELRPFRMAVDAATFSALAALVRALVARLMHHPYPQPLKDWGDELHQRFALPYFLQQDLRAVLDDLRDHGLGLGNELCARLLDDSARIYCALEWNGVSVRLSRAHEFWPLIGDVTGQQPGDSRLVDASTARVEVCVHGLPPGAEEDWELRIEGYRAPMSRQPEGAAITLVSGVRYRTFVPWQGLHPALAARDRVTIELVHGASGRALRLCLHEWLPDGGAYPGLPADRPEAARRRRERVTVDEPEAASLPPLREPPAVAAAGYCLDLRRLTVPG